MVKIVPAGFGGLLWPPSLRLRSGRGFFVVTFKTPVVGAQAPSQLEFL